MLLHPSGAVQRCPGHKGPGNAVTQAMGEHDHLHTAAWLFLWCEELGVGGESEERGNGQGGQNEGPLRYQAAPRILADLGKNVWD